MTVGGISGQTFYEKLHHRKDKQMQHETQAQTAFSKNLKENDPALPEEEPSVTESTAVIHGASSSLHTAMMIQESGRIQLHAVVECSARHISYAQSDHVKVCVSEGYTFKAQVQAERHSVYIEKKTDDGEVTGYEINPLKLDKNTTDPLEQMALEAWELSRRAFMGENPSFHEISPDTILGKQAPVLEEPEDDYSSLTISEAMKRFTAFVEDRIKNGDPKYQIGGSEMSVKEWNRLIAKIDDEIDAAKEQLREELRKAKKVHAAAADQKEEDKLLGITKEQIARLFEDPDKKPKQTASETDTEEVYQPWMGRDAKKQEEG